MKTQIFKNHSEFLSRTDKDINGVDAEFAKENPSYEKQNETNKGCWNCFDCYDCSGCFGCSDCSSCSGCFGCSDCSSCSGCYDCSDCFGCSGCYDCFGCYGLENKKDQKENKEKSESWFKVPIIENIHQKILEAVSKENALDMSTWHSESCDTTHCRAGWAEVLGGADGKALAVKSSTLFAAMQIYKASSSIRVSPVRFFENNEHAMEDIKRCAELEKKQINLQIP